MGFGGSETWGCSGGKSEAWTGKRAREKKVHPRLSGKYYKGIRTKGDALEGKYSTADNDVSKTVLPVGKKSLRRGGSLSKKE